MTTQLDPVYQDILNKQNASIVTNSDPREQFKNKKIKKLKNISCSQELEREKETDLPSALLGEVTSFPDTSPEGLEAARDGKGVVAASATTSSREKYSGIAVQHARTRRGTKLYITLQTPEDAAESAWLSVTAELKRRDRLREVKSAEYDSPWFDDVLATAKEFCRDQGSDWHIGRIHDRSKRSAWHQDSLVLAHTHTDGSVDQAILLLGLERYDVPMREELSDRQQQYYHSQGIWGQLQRLRHVPTLDSAPRRRASYHD